MRGGFQAHQVVGWSLLIAVALYGLYSYGAAEWGRAHLLHSHFKLRDLPLQHVTSSSSAAVAAVSSSTTTDSSSSDGSGSSAAEGLSSLFRLGADSQARRGVDQQQRAAAQPLSTCADAEEDIDMSSGAWKESYSIWAMPKGKLGAQLKGEIAHLAERHGVNAFPPHVTVLGDIERPREEAVALMRELAAQVKKYRINFVEVTRGSIFYQCVYLLVAKDEGTMAAAAAARSVFGMTTPPYMPHLSLLYSDMDQADRAKVVEYETARLYGESSGYDTLLVETGYEVGSLALWYTPTEDKSLQSWCMVDEFELAAA